MPREYVQEYETEPYEEVEEKEISLIDTALVLTRNRKMILRIFLVCTVLGFLYAILPDDPEYVSSAVVIREISVEDGQGGLGQIGGLGLGIGLNLGQGVTGLTVEAYPDILESREVRLAVVRDSFYISRGDSTVLLAEYLTPPRGAFARFLSRLRNYTVRLPTTIKRSLEGNRGAPSSARTLPAPAGSDTDIPGESAESYSYPTGREEQAISELGAMVDTQVDRESGLMTIMATTADPRLSADLVTAFINQLRNRVQAIRSEKSRQNVEFIQTRYQSAAAELRQAEDELAQFMDRNAGFQSAELMTRVERLERQVQLRTQLFLELQMQLARAELDVQRSKPVITVLEAPVPPLSSRSASTGTVVIAAMMFGLFLGVGLAFLRTLVEGRTVDEEEKEKMAELTATLPASVRRALGFDSGPSHIESNGR